MIIKLTSIVSREKSKWYKPKKSQEIGIKFTITDRSNFDKGCPGDHFVFLILLLLYILETLLLSTYCRQKVYFILKNCTSLFFLLKQKLMTKLLFHHSVSHAFIFTYFKYVVVVHVQLTTYMHSGIYNNGSKQKTSQTKSF